MYLYSFDFFCDEIGKTFEVEVECKVGYEYVNLASIGDLIIEEQKFFVLSDVSPFMPLTDLGLIERAKQHYYKFEQEKCFRKLTEDFEENKLWQKED
jgi:hypothetical protein